jgi:hypothetical protein
LHQIVIDINDRVWVLDRGHIVICWLLILSWFGSGGSEFALMRGLVRHLLDIGKWVDCKGITQTLIPDTLAVKPKASQSTDGNLLWSVVYISDTVCLHMGAADDTQPALADPHPLRWPWPVTGRYATGVP